MERQDHGGGPEEPDSTIGLDQPRQLGAWQAAGLWVAAALAVVPSLPFVQSQATAFVRFHNWALFVAGLILGWLLTAARATLR